MRNKHYIKIFTCLLCLGAQLTISTASAQDNLSDIHASFDGYHQNSIKEKIFAHTDKNFYVAGEILWFKLYVVDASTHIPLDLSKVAYVEITDSVNKEVLQAKISLKNAEGDGSFYLPVNLNSGNYKLRAYTNWMKNYDAAYFFEKDITVVNVQKNMEAPVARSLNKYDIQFFPEGGNLVENIPSKVAFKAVDQHGKGITFTGFLLDNTDTLLTFTPQHAGMGSFTLTPLPHHSYKAFIRIEPGVSLIKDLPPAYNSGYVLHVSDSADKIKVTLQGDVATRSKIYLVVSTREIIKMSASGVLQDGKAVFIFDKALPGDGISYFTIFNDQKQAVCERLYFKRPAKQWDIKLTANQPVYATRKKVSITIRPAETGIQYDSASLSMAVYRMDALQASDAATINSYLLLTSDLKGFVEDPNYYFLKDDAETNTALDNLMLTNGWRRFKWEDVLKNKPPLFKYVPEYDGLIIAGNVINTKTGNPANNVESYISSPGKQSAFTSSLSNTAGRVFFELKKFYGSSELILQTNTMRDSAYRVEITDPFSDNFSGTPFPVFTLNRADTNSLREQSISMQVQNIYTGKNLKHFIKPSVDTAAFYVKPDEKYLLDDYTRFTTVEEILREYVTLVDVKKRLGTFHFSLFDLANTQMFKTDPLVMVDGVPVFDLNKFMLTDPLKLYKLEVLNRKYFLGGSLFDGVLNWTSYKGDMADYDPGAYATVIDYDGLQMQREFYSPSYADEDQQTSHLPDFRNVLLWSPGIKIASGASKEINFYSSDLPGKYAVQVQGINKNGSSGNQVFTFEVKR